MHRLMLKTLLSALFSLSILGASAAGFGLTPHSPAPPVLLAQETRECVTVAQDLKDADAAGDELIAPFEDVTVPTGLKLELLLAYRVTRSPVPLIVVVGFVDGCAVGSQHFSPKTYEEFVKHLKTDDPA